MTFPPQFTAIAEPQHLALAEFLHGSSPDPATRAMAATTLVFSLWQVAGRSLTPQPPWMVLVNAGEAVDDPLDAVAEFHTAGLNLRAEPGKGTCLAAGTSPEKAQEILAQAVINRQTLRETAPDKTSEAEQAEFLHAKAKSTLYGQGLTRPYSRAWHDIQEWITDDKDDAILRLDGPPDRVALRRDVLSQLKPMKLLKPAGMSGRLQMVQKTLALSGSLTPDLCDTKLVEGLLGLGLPMFFLPHIAQDPLKGIQNSLLRLNMKMAAGNCTPFHTPSHLPPDPWCLRYERVLRNRLHFLPGDYAFSVLRTIRDLGPVCSSIVGQAVNEADGETHEEALALFSDLYALSFRGILLSIVALAYHGLGFNPGCERPDALDILNEVRKTGSCTRRELQRKVREFKAEELDTVLTRLACEGLVRPESRKVTAVTPADFVKTLPTRTGLAEPELHWPKLMAKKES